MSHPDEKQNFLKVIKAVSTLAIQHEVEMDGK